MIKMSALTGLQELWQQTLGSPDIRIAVLDGPVNQAHPCFEKANLRVLPSLIQGEEPVGLMAAHGTHVASLIFGQHNSSIKGIAPKCQGLLLPIFSEQQPQVSQLDLARAINQAVDAGANIISISGGQLTEAGEASEFLEKAVQYCYEQNVLVVAAAGNDGCDCLHVPASLAAVLAVGALNEQGEPLASSNWGERYNYKGILAPGANIVGAEPGGGTACLTGTSFAAPIVTGIAALILSLKHQRGESINPHHARSLLLGTSLPCEPQTTDQNRHCLMGKLNIPGVLSAIQAKPIQGEIIQGEAMSAASINPAGCGCGAIAQTEGHLQAPESRTPELDSLHSTPLQATADATAMMATSAEVVSSPSAVLSNDAAAASATASASSGSSGIAATAPVPMMAHSTPVSHQHDPSFDTAMTQDTAMTHSAYAAPSGYATPATVTPSEPPPAKSTNLVFALGTLGYDFGTEARRDSFKQLMPQWTPEDASAPIPPNPYDARQMADYLGEHLSEASSLIWTLNLELTPIYAIEPHGSFAREVYAALQDLLAGEVLAEDEPQYIQRVSVPGILTGKTVKLFSGQVVPVIQPSTMRGLYGWKINSLVEEAIAAVETVEGLRDQPEDSQDRLAVRQKMQRALASLLSRIYYDLRNLGQTSQERALNFAATNAFQTAAALSEAVGGGMELDTISVEKSPYCRKDSDCWDVKLKFFDPENRRRARQVFRFTIDVSDLIPVTLGEVRSWRVPS